MNHDATLVISLGFSLLALVIGVTGGLHHTFRRPRHIAPPPLAPDSTLLKVLSEPTSWMNLEPSGITWLPDGVTVGTFGAFWADLARLLEPITQDDRDLLRWADDGGPV